MHELLPIVEANLQKVNGVFPGFIDVHRPKIEQCIQIITAAHEQESYRDKYYGFEDIFTSLLNTAEEVSGDNLRYSYSELLELTLPYANNVRATIKRFDNKRSSDYDLLYLGNNDVEYLRVCVQELTSIKQYHQIVSAQSQQALPSFINSRYYYGLMRSIPNCHVQIANIAELLMNTDFRLYRNVGTVGDIDHQIGIALHKTPAHELFTLSYSDNLIMQPLISTDLADSQLPVLEKPIIVDASIMQFMNASEFKRDRLWQASPDYAERIEIVANLSPDNITSNGIFVGNAVEYITLLCRLGIANAYFEMPTRSW